MLKERREAAGLSVEELAELSGVSKNTIWTWERHGVECASVKNAKKVADVLGVWIDQLMTDEYDEGDADEGNDQ